MKLENSVEYLEDEARKLNITKLESHLAYFNNVYNFCFEIQHGLNDKSPKDVGELINAQMILLMRVTDFLRCIYLDVVKGYPEQAGTLASSVFELVHTGIYFQHIPEVIENWWNGDSEKKMPQLIGKNTYRDLVEYNCKIINGPAEEEWRIYQQLCWMKHSHPIMHDILIENFSMKYQIGPYTDERSIDNSKFILIQSARLTEFLIFHIHFPESVLSDEQVKKNREKLDQFVEQRKKLCNL